MKQANTALIPVPKLEEDFYDWYERHQAVLDRQRAIDPEVVLVGDSITHLWGGEPASFSNGQLAGASPALWEAVFDRRRVLNLGFGWDRTQNVLWRLENGQLEGLHPSTIMLLIGTNNLTGTANARENTPGEIHEGILAIHRRLRQKAPQSRIIVMGLLPRGLEPNSPFRPRILAINEMLSQSLTGQEKTIFTDIGSQLLASDGTLPPTIAPDGVHLSEAGYEIWGRAVRPLWEV